MNLSETLIKWYSKNKRDLPWRKEVSPYQIWLSEIILQQTRVTQGLDYYRKFISRFPSIYDLAEASLDEVMKLWQGLGYYSRARNLHYTAKVIVENFGGNFPKSYNEILKLKGIGSYTAAAIASIVFNEPVPVVDGNVYRFFARFFNMEIPINSSQGKKEFYHVANLILHKENPGIYNQAIMEFGALQCVPKNPKCISCLLKDHCIAFLNKHVHKLPVKTGKKTSRNRYFNYFFIIYNEYTFLRQRKYNDIWKMLYEFPMIETNNESSENDILKSDSWINISKGINSICVIEKSKEYFHQLSHRKIYTYFYKIEIENMSKYLSDHYIKIQLKDLKNYAIPRLIEKYLQENIDYNYF